MIYNHISQLIGHTPLLSAERWSSLMGHKATVLCKLECFNPAGSSKDRVAFAMLERAKAEGALMPGGTIIEPTSGNTGTDFLIELGTGFAYVGKEYCLPIGQTENFIDLLFYNIRLRCYVVVEVKIEKFDPRDIGQLGTYVTAVNHILRDEEKDNPTIGLLICKSKDNTLAKYALESSSQPIGISEYELERFYPAKVQGTMPSIEEIESKLKDK